MGVNGGEAPAQEDQGGHSGIGIGRCEFLVLKEGLCGQSTGKARAEREGEIGQTSGVRTQGFILIAEGSQFSRGVIGCSLRLQMIPLSRSPHVWVCRGLSRVMLFAWCNYLYSLLSLSKVS